MEPRRKTVETQNNKKLDCTKGHNFYKNSNKNEAQNEDLHLSHNEIVPMGEKK